VTVPADDSAQECELFDLKFPLGELDLGLPLALDDVNDLAKSRPLFPWKPDSRQAPDSLCCQVRLLGQRNGKATQSSRLSKIPTTDLAGSLMESIDVKMGWQTIGPLS
jgi:hypothetical protein